MGSSFDCKRNENKEESVIRKNVHEIHTVVLFARAAITQAVMA